MMKSLYCFGGTIIMLAEYHRLLKSIAMLLLEAGYKSRHLGIGSILEKQLLFGQFDDIENGAIV